MTIMFAGGMTIAIPGELPVAVAQSTSGTLSVSATTFGGPQVVEIVIDDPDLNEVGTDATRPVASISITDGETVTMTQANTGKWYAYIADASAYADSQLAATVSNDDFLRDLPRLAADQSWPTPAVVQTQEFEDDVEITAGRDEVITITYDDDSAAAISSDRSDVPADGQVRITISDFQLNLDPTAADEWVLSTDGTETYFEGSVTLLNDDVAELEIGGLNPAIAGEITSVAFEETGTNTGVFESADGAISIMADAEPGESFEITYAGETQQIIVGDFSDTLELITDGTWDAGEPLTVRVTDESLNLDTEADEFMSIQESDNIPVVILGTPITLDTIESVTINNPNLGDGFDTDGVTHVGTLTVTTNDAIILEVALTDDQLARVTNNEGLSHYYYYSSAASATTNAEIELPAGSTIDPTVIPLTADELTKIVVRDSADGNFNITVAVDGTIDSAGTDTNTALLNILTQAEAAAEDATATAVKDAAESAADGANVPDAAEEAIDTIDAGEDADRASVIADVERIVTENLVTADIAIVADIYTFGENADETTENHAIYRALLEETDSGSGVFEGTIEYQMLNQRTVNAETTHDDITVLDMDLAIILDNGYTGTDGVTVEYGDKDIREDAPSHTGEVSLDSETYRVADTVTITLADADLNTLSSVDIYTIDATGDDLLDVGIIPTCAEEIESISMRETASDSGVFEGTFDVPATCGVDSDGDPIRTTGESITVTYYDFRDASGAGNEWADSATIGADTGSITLDRTVYPVPGDDAVTLHIAVSDADEDESSDSAETLSSGLVTVTIDGEDFTLTKNLEETSPDTGVFEVSISLNSTANRADNEDNRIEQGDIITVEYTDQSDASGSENTASDSATFDLRNAVLQSDKSTYVIGQDALITLIEPDLNLDSSVEDNVKLSLIQWDSDAYDGEAGIGHGDFGAVPQSLRENGANSGIFHVVITIPEDIDNIALERGEEITLTYNDQGPSGADFVGDDDRDVELFIATSDFGATVELDQNVYTWTDKVFITIVASDYNFDSNIVDEIGTEDEGEITIRTRSDELEEYRLAETGPDTGVFTGEVTLTGQDEVIDDGPSGETSGPKSGPTSGMLEAKSSDGLSVTFDFSDGQAPIVASALIRWNVGEVQWLEASHAATGSGIVRVIDPDMNINPDAVDSLEIVAYSETFVGGIDLTVTETREASGIFEGTVEFDPNTASQGHRLQVTEGDIITAVYEDVTLPDDDSLEITATTLIGSIVPPLERAPASNPAIVDAFGNSLASVSADQQVQITADITSGQDRDQDFAYLVQIQNEDEVTVALSWITGTLGAGATFNAAQSWTPSETGSYTATIFVWESVSNPTALSPQLSITIDVV